ncbi:ester cyclase [Actinosynnema sp. NPDC050801]|uniref:ester cyclase n=1 Tax=unclassified Actinosynnema TaxID=2637065 RepID=UPI003402B20A
MTPVLAVEQRNTITAEDVRGVVEDFIRAVNDRDLDAAVDLLAADAVHRGRISNYRPEGVKVLLNLLIGVLPDLRLDVVDMRVEGDRAVTRVVGTGTHTGSYLGKRPSGRPIAWESVDIARVGVRDDGSVAILDRYWDIYSDVRVWQEIGFIPAIMC